MSDDIDERKRDWQEERGGRIDPMKYPDDEAPIDDGARIDEAIAESYPASDPPSWNSGITRDPETSD